MKELTDNLKHEIHKSHTGGFNTKLQWNQLFDTEQELIDCMMITNTDNRLPTYKLPRGYEYIDSFKKYYTKNNSLTEKQMIQLKRLASEIVYVNYLVK